MAWPEPFAYFGTSDFSARVLQGLCQLGYKPSLVITTAAKPAGRGLRTADAPVAAAAQALALPVLKVATLRTPEVISQLKQNAASFAVLVAFGKIVPAEVLALYPKGIINAHPSVLPKYRGPSPIQAAILKAEAETGVSLMRLDEQVDHGPVLAQTRMAIEVSDTAASLAKSLAQQAIKLLDASIAAYLRGEVPLVPQDHTQATFTKPIVRVDGQADFNRSAEDLDRQRRAFTPWPGLWTTWQGKRLKLLATQPLPRTASGPPGTVGIMNDDMFIACGRNSLRINKLQTAGGRVVTGGAFMHGHGQLAGARLPS